MIAVAFQPARERSRRLANRLVYGERASPYEVLSKFSRGMAGASTDDSLLQMARLVVEATGAEQVTVWLRLGDLLQPQARWPPTGQPPDPIALDGYSLEKALVEMQPGSQSFPVAHEEEQLGALTVTISPREPLTPASEKLIADLAAQTGLGLRFQRMKERALFARALASFLPPEVAELVEASPSALSLRRGGGHHSVLRHPWVLLAGRTAPSAGGRRRGRPPPWGHGRGCYLQRWRAGQVCRRRGDGGLRRARPTADHARQALLCAAAMQRRRLTLNEEATQEGLPAFQIGIGVNTGTVIAGTVGGPGRLDYTVLGDAVNIAQRLQAMAVGGEILATVVTVRQSGTDQAEPSGSSSSKDTKN